MIVIGHWFRPFAVMMPEPLVDDVLPLMEYCALAEAFDAMLDANAPESAALLIMRERLAGWNSMVGDHDLSLTERCGRCFLTERHGPQMIHCDATTPALALIAAMAKALETSHDR